MVYLGYNKYLYTVSIVWMYPITLKIQTINKWLGNMYHTLSITINYTMEICKWSLCEQEWQTVLHPCITSPRWQHRTATRDAFYCTTKRDFHCSQVLWFASVTQRLEGKQEPQTVSQLWMKSSGQTEQSEHRWAFTEEVQSPVAAFFAR